MLLRGRLLALGILLCPKSISPTSLQAWILRSSHKNMQRLFTCAPCCVSNRQRELMLMLLRLSMYSAGKVCAKDLAAFMKRHKIAATPDEIEVCALIFVGVLFHMYFPVCFIFALFSCVLQTRTLLYCASFKVCFMA